MNPLNFVFFSVSKKGFTLVEIMIAITIVTIISAIGVSHFSNNQNQTTLKSEVNSLIFRLEEAKTNAMSGKNGEDQGVKINDNSYVLFSGDTYDTDDSDNVEYEISNLTELSSTDDTIVFERITGEISSETTVTVSLKKDPSQNTDIIIETKGLITKVSN